MFSRCIHQSHIFDCNCSRNNKRLNFMRLIGTLDLRNSLLNSGFYPKISRSWLVIFARNIVGQPYSEILGTIGIQNLIPPKLNGGFSHTTADCIFWKGLFLFSPLITQSLLFISILSNIVLLRCFEICQKVSMLNLESKSI